MGTLSLKNVIHFTIYIAICCYFLSRIIQSYLWLEKKELGTIYKVDFPGFVVYPSITICPMPNKRGQIEQTVNASWDVPKPNLTNILTYLEHAYYKNDRYFDKYLLFLHITGG